MSSAAASINGLPPIPAQQWAHDIRNVLATVAVRLNTLERLSGPAGAHAAGLIHDLISRVQALCDQAVLQGHDLKHTTRRRCIEVADIVGQAAEIALPAAPQGFQIEIAGRARLSALADPTDLFRIIFNLFHNAIAVAHESGTLSVVHVHVSELSQRVVVDIFDNGPGLPARVKNRLFRPRPRRFGLRLRGFGLAIARELAERNGGSLKHLETNEGAHFRLRLMSGVATAELGRRPTVGVPSAQLH